MIIKNAILHDNTHCDLEITNGYISDIKQYIISNSIDIVDISNKVLLPQFIDLNTYPKDKNLSINAINNLYKKAVKGGVGCILIMPDTMPSIDNEIIAELVNVINKEGIYSITNAINSNGKISDISIIHSYGARGIYLQSNLNSNIIDKIAKYAKMLDIPIFVNAYDAMGGLINYGEVSFELGLEPRHPLSEIKEVSKIIEVAIFYNIKVIFSAISEPRSIELINEAKKINPNIFSEVSIHHLTLNDKECENYNTKAKINPPLKDEKAREKLMYALIENKIDLLTSLQCENSLKNKELVFNEAAFGLDSIENYFGILFTKLIKTNIISWDQLLTLCVYNPAKILNLDSRALKIGEVAKLMVVDLKQSYVIKNSNSLFYGREYFGVVERFI